MHPALIQLQKEGISEFANSCSDCGLSSPVSLSGQGLVFLVMNEEWKPIVGYERFYEVSNHGRVRSVARTIPHRNRWGQEATLSFPTRVVKNYTRKDSYVSVCLCRDGVLKNFLVHRLVTEHFLPNPDGLPVTNHKNGIKGDNRVENLEHCTLSQNSRHAFATGLFKPVCPCGEKNGSSKLTAQIVLEMRALRKAGRTLQSIADCYGVTNGTVSKIELRKSWRHI